MLFELFLVVGITVLPISIAALIIGSLVTNEWQIKPFVIGIAIGIVCILLAITLPPIPIIPK